MTLATHAVVGGAVASLFPSHPVIAFFAGFFSHFILDAIPHWDYKILSSYANPSIAMSANAKEPGTSKMIRFDRTFGFDLLRTGADAILGILATLIILHFIGVFDWRLLLLGAVGGILPDFLQFVYMRFPYQPMIWIQRFHNFIHGYRLDNKKWVTGVIYQIAVVICAVLLVRYLIQL